LPQYFSLFAGHPAVQLGFLKKLNTVANINPLKLSSANSPAKRKLTFETAIGYRFLVGQSVRVIGHKRKKVNDRGITLRGFVGICQSPRAISILIIAV
jgi:hypothetical protein